MSISLAGTELKPAMADAFTNGCVASVFLNAGMAFHVLSSFGISTTNVCSFVKPGFVSVRTCTWLYTVLEQTIRVIEAVNCIITNTF